jgi:hypothetical protein
MVARAVVVCARLRWLGQVFENSENDNNSKDGDSDTVGLSLLYKWLQYLRYANINWYMRL